MTEPLQAIEGDRKTVAPADGEHELHSALDNLLSAVDLHGGELDEALQDLEVPFGDAVYSELFHSFCHLRLDAGEAKRLWGEVLAHRGMMQERLRAPLDLRVAMLSYLVEVRHALDDPKVIERSEIERTQEFDYTDPLTGLRNFRYFEEQLNHEVLRSEQYGEPLSLIMLDIDHFKAFNESNGHEAGNEVLRRVGGIIRETLRDVEIGARYGGEEFAVILPSTPKRGAHAAAERLRARIAASEFPFAADQPPGRVTASLGVATYPAEGRSAAEFVEQCHRALRAAKTEGRDRVGLLSGMRSHPRVQVELDGRCRAAGEERLLRTIEFGAGGMSFRTTSPLEIGALVEAEIDLPERAMQLALSGRVLRVSPEHEGWTEVAMRFVDVAPADRRLLTSLVRNAWVA